MSNASYHIREATEDDCEEVICLIKELASWENMADHVNISAEDLRRDGFGQEQCFGLLVAESTAEGVGSKRPLVGYAMYYFSYNPWYGKTCCLESFYVQPNWRKRGIGSALWAHVTKAALEIGCSKVDWIVLKGNKLAIDFYTKNGGVDVTEEEGWLIFGMDKDSMRSLVATTLVDLA